MDFCSHKTKENIEYKLGDQGYNVGMSTKSY